MARTACSNLLSTLTLLPNKPSTFTKNLQLISVLDGTKTRLYSSSSRISMSLRAGIVGLPNVGKSTLLNAVVENGKAQAANFPFCTIEPNVGIVAVPDPRLHVLSELSKSQRAVPASIEFVDIAGLVKGASQGEGLGNKFLSHIREVDSILQVVRCFEDNDIVHVNGKVDPKSDIDVINLELVFSDLDQFYGSTGKETEMIDEPFFDDLVEENDEDDETEGSVDFLMRFLQSMFRKVLKRAKKASRSTLLAAISTQLVSFVVDKVLLLATLSIVKTLLKLFCTLGDRKWRIENK